MSRLPGAPLAAVAVAVSVAVAVPVAVAGCTLVAAPSATPPVRPPAPTLIPAFGLTWAMAPDVERPADAFAISSDPPTGPANPDTAGHPGHFPGQAIIEDVAASSDRLVAVGYVGLNGDWQARSWTSTDGLSWAVGPIDDATGSFAVSVAVAADGGFVAVGRAGREAAAWTSADGTTWVRATVASLVPAGSATRAPEQAERMTVVITTADGLLAGGSVGAELLGDHRARFWQSADGRAWQPVPDERGAFADAEVTAISETPAGFVAVGHLEGGARPTGSLAWTTSDATTWTRCPAAALGAGLAAAVVATPAGLLAVGSDADEREAVAWSSPDGCAWTKAPTEASRLHSGEKIRMTDVAATPKGFVGVGNYVGVQFGTGTSWLSADGLRWTQAPDQPTFGQGEPEAVITWRDRLVIVGSRGAPDNYIPSVWLSPGLP